MKIFQESGSFWHRACSHLPSVERCANDLMLSRYLWIEAHISGLKIINWVCGCFFFQLLFLSRIFVLWKKSFFPWKIQAIFVVPWEILCFCALKGYFTTRDSLQRYDGALRVWFELYCGREGKRWRMIGWHGNIFHPNPHPRRTIWSLTPTQGLSGIASL